MAVRVGAPSSPAPPRQLYPPDVHTTRASSTASSDDQIRAEQTLGLAGVGDPPTLRAVSPSRRPPLCAVLASFHRPAVERKPEAEAEGGPGRAEGPGRSGRRGGRASPGTGVPKPSPPAGGGGARDLQSARAVPFPGRSGAICGRSNRRQALSQESRSVRLALTPGFPWPQSPTPRFSLSPCGAPGRRRAVSTSGRAGRRRAGQRFVRLLGLFIYYYGHTHTCARMKPVRPFDTF